MPPVPARPLPSFSTACLLFLAAPLLALATGFGAEPSEHAADTAEPLLLPGLDEVPTDALDPGEKAATVLFFVSPYCPTANNFSPWMNELIDEFGGRFAFRFIQSDPDVTKADILQHAALMGFDAPVLHDEEQVLATRLGATITPEAFVIDSAGEILYQGRVNDYYLTATRRQREVTTHDLRDALEEIAAGKPVSTPRTEAVGCRLGEARP